MQRVSLCLPLIKKIKVKRKTNLKSAIEEDNYKGFPYVLCRKPPQELCFGSKLPRVVLSSQQGKNGTCDPGAYDIVRPEKPRSKRGLPGLANTAKRESSYGPIITPGPGRYDLIPKPPPRKCRPPFNSNLERIIIEPKEGPGPTVYNAHKVNKCKRTRFYYNFGRPCLAPAVEYVCKNYPTEKCEKCRTPVEYGDYWHKNYSTYLCTFCMAEEHRLHELYKRSELLTFKKIRTCTYMHRHEGTSASVKLMSQKHVDKKIRLENYLSLYFQCHGTKSKPEINLPKSVVL